MSDGEQEFVLAAVLPAEPVFTLVAYRPGDAGLVAEQFGGREARTLSGDVLSEHVQAELRVLLELATSGGERNTVVVGRTDGEGGWASWHLGFIAPKPGPVPALGEGG